MLLICSSAALYAQNNKLEKDKINSLLQALSEAKNDTSKINLLNNIAFAYRTIKPAKGIEYGNQALILAQKLNWKKGTADADYALGSNYLHSSNYSSAATFFESALKLYKETNDKKGWSNTLIGFGDRYKAMGRYIDAEDFYKSADTIKEAIKDINGKANCCARIGSLYELRGNFPKALTYDLEALGIFEKSGDKLGLAENLQNIGAIYQKLKDYDNAQKYYSRAQNINEQLDNKTGVAACFEKSGTLYRQQGNFSKALSLYNKALAKYTDDIGDKLGEASILTEIGNTYMAEGNYPKALDYDFTALRKFKELNNKYGMAASMTNIATAYKLIANATNIIKSDTYIPDGRDAQQKYALAYIDSAIAWDRDMENLDGLQQAYNERANIEEMIGNYAEANSSLKQYAFYHDSLYNSENTKKEAERFAEFEHKGIEDSLEYQKRLSDTELSKETLLAQKEHTLDSLEQLTLQSDLEHKEASLQFHQQREKELQDKSKLQDKMIALNKASIRQQQIISYFYIGGIAALLVISFFVYRSFAVQKKLNKVITQLISEREKTIELRTAELRVSNEKLHIANAKLIELIQFNAHNIREPLTRVMGLMMLREYVPDEEFLQNYWQMIEKSVNDLDNTIKQVIFSAENSTNTTGNESISN